MQNEIHDQQNFEVRLFVHGDISFVAADLLPTKFRSGGKLNVRRNCAHHAFENLLSKSGIARKRDITKFQ